MEKVQEYGNFIEQGKGYRKEVRVCKRCQGMKRHQGMGKVSGYGKEIMVLKWCQDMEMVPGYGNGIGLGWYKKASEYGNGMHHALLDKLSSLKGLI